MGMDLYVQLRLSPPFVRRILVALRVLCSPAVVAAGLSRDPVFLYHHAPILGLLDALIRRMHLHFVREVCRVV